MALDPHAAGVDPTVYHDFTPGQRVMTREGFAGVVTDVQDGPIGGSESYLVTLDRGMGGGAYSSSDLSAMASPPTTRTASIFSELHEASEDYPELWDVLRNRPPPENQMQPHTAAWMVVDDKGATHSGPHDTVYDARNDIAEEGLDPQALNVIPEPTFEGDVMFTGKKLIDKVIDWYGETTHYQPGQTKSIDWCRFRRDSHCWYPKALDVVNSRRAGYAVWIPEDRGYCPRNRWDDQKDCPMSKPGPRSGDPMAQPEATLSWEEGGQRVSIRTNAAIPEPTERCEVCGKPATWTVGGHLTCIRHRQRFSGPIEQVLYKAAMAALDDEDLSFHFHATWADVRAKAKRIRSEGHVRVLSATQGYVTAEIRGDTNIYQTTIMRVPGGKSTAMWECGCAWANYSWGRSGRWKKYEGRMCAHALALTYEAQAREMFGKEITEDRNLPQWRNDPTIPVVVPGDVRTKPRPWRTGMAVEALPMLKVHPSLEELADWFSRAARSSEPRVSRDMQEVATAEGGMLAGFAHRLKDEQSILEKLHRKGESKLRSGWPPGRVVQDALRYTIVFHPLAYTAGVQDCLYRFQEKGYKLPSKSGDRYLEEQNSWEPGDSFSGLSYTMTEPGGLDIELQFATAASFVLKQKTLHRMYEKFRDERTSLAEKQRLYDLMTKEWDKIEIPKDVLGFPERGIEGFPKPYTYGRPAHLMEGTDRIPHWASTDPELALAPVEAMRKQAWLMALVRGTIERIKALVGEDHVRLDDGKVVPATEVIHPDYDPHAGIVDFHPRLAGKRDMPSSSYGMRYDPDLASHPEVQAAENYSGWKSIPLTTISPQGLHATEDLLQSSTISRLVEHPDQIRSGYDPFIARLTDGREVVIDGHHRVAIANAAGHGTLQVHLLDMRTHHEGAYFWKDSGEELSLADVERMAIEDGKFTEDDLQGMRASKQKMYPDWLWGQMRQNIYSRWGGPTAPLTMRTGVPPEPKEKPKPYTMEEVEEAFPTYRRPQMAASLAGDDEEYELLSSTRGKALTHIGTGRYVKGQPQPIALCGTTVAPLDSVQVGYMEAMAQATCQRCLDILRKKKASLDPLLFEADLHDEPEPALPSTDGEEQPSPPTVVPSPSVVSDEGHKEERGIPEVVGHTSPGAITAPDWLAPGGGNGSDRMKAHQAANAELAEMARAFLKDGSKVFTTEEQQAIINEDTEERAANLDRLNIEGTHYEALALLDPDDDGWLN